MDGMRNVGETSVWVYISIRAWASSPSQQGFFSAFELESKTCSSWKRPVVTPLLLWTQSYENFVLLKYINIALTRFFANEYQCLIVFCDSTVTAAVVRCFWFLVPESFSLNLPQIFTRRWHDYEDTVTSHFMFWVTAPKFNITPVIKHLSPTSRI